MAAITSKGQLETFLPFQATVVDVDENDGVITAEVKAGVTFRIPPAYYGGVKDHGLFMHPSVGDTLLCVRIGGIWTEVGRWSFVRMMGSAH